jgi:hypothetical protein
VNLRRRQRRHGHELQIGIPEQLARQIEERLLEVVVGLGRDVVVLKIIGNC